MESPVGNATAALSEHAAQRPEAYEFFQLVRLLEAGGGRPIGLDHPPTDEALSLRTQPSLTFPPTAVVAKRNGRGDTPDQRELALSFLGLIGPLGTLPQSYTELVLERLHLRDSSLRDFLDLLHHRAASLFYRAWRKYRLPFAFEHARRVPGREDPCTRVLLSLVGLGTGVLADNAGAPPYSWVFYGGHFAARTRSAADFESLLQAETSAPVRVEEFCGQWIPLSESSRTRLGGGGREAAHNRLGDQAILGEQVWDVQSKVRVHVGPVGLERFGALQPGGAALAPVIELARAYLGPTVDFDFEVALDPAAVPPLQLGGPAGAALGRSSWLPAEHPDPADLRVRIRADSR